jgi:hypothetical protein
MTWRSETGASWDTIWQTSLFTSSKCHMYEKKADQSDQSVHRDSTLTQPYDFLFCSHFLQSPILHQHTPWSTKWPFPDKTPSRRYVFEEFDNLRMKADLRIQRNKSSRTLCDLENEVNHESCLTNHQRYWETWAEKGKTRTSPDSGGQARVLLSSLCSAGTYQIPTWLTINSMTTLDIFALWHQTSPSRAFGVLTGQTSCQISQSTRCRGWSDWNASDTLI